MKARRTLIVVAGLSVISALTISLWPHSGISDGSIICASTHLSLEGPMPDGRNVEVRNIKQSTSGVMMEASFLRSPPTVIATLCGSQHFQFTYSPNIVEVEISVAGATLYEGPPIASLDASKRPKGQIQVRFRWEGDGATISVANG